MTESNITHGQPPHRHLQKPGSCGMIIADVEAKVQCVQFLMEQLPSDFLTSLSQHVWTTTPVVTVNQELQLSTYSHTVLSWSEWSEFFGGVV